MIIPVANLVITYRYPKTGLVLNLASFLGQVILILALFQSGFHLSIASYDLINNLIPG